MQDRFKFRCYNKFLEKMFEVKNISYINGIVKRIEVQDDERILIFDEWQNNIDNTVLMQCTGLTDKNGKLIYEGDIVKTYPSGFFDAYTNIFFIKNNLCGFYLATPYKNMSGDWECQDTIGCYDKKMYEVIGNIYENPKLLED